MATIAALVVNIAADVSDIQRNTQKAADAVEGMAGRMNTAVGALAGLFAIDRIVAFTQEVIRAGAEVSAMADRLDDSVANVQRLQGAAIETSVSIESLTSAVQTLQQKLGDGSAAEALARINLRVAELRGLAPVEAYSAVAEALGRVEDSATRAALAKQLLGNNAKAVAATFRDDFGAALEDVVVASDSAVQAMDAIEKAGQKAWRTLVLGAQEFLATITLIAAYRDIVDMFDPGKLPTPAASAFLPQPLQSPAIPDIGAESREINEALKAAQALEEHWREYNRSVEASLELIKRFGTEAPASIQFVSDAILQLRQAQEAVAAQVDRWVTDMTTRGVAAAEAITERLVRAITINAALRGEALETANQIQQRLIEQANASANVKIFEAPEALSRVDQADRATALRAEAAILDEANLKVLALQSGFEGVTSRTHDAVASAMGLLQTYDTLQQRLNQARGLASPDEIQRAFEAKRYFGPVRPDGTPDLERLGVSSAPVNNVTVNAQGGFFQSPQDLDRLARLVADALSRDISMGRKLPRN